MDGGRREPLVVGRSTAGLHGLGRWDERGISGGEGEEFGVGIKVSAKFKVRDARDLTKCAYHVLHNKAEQLELAQLLHNTRILI